MESWRLLTEKKVIVKQYVCKMCHILVKRYL